MAVKNTVCLSLLEFCPPAINPEFVMECKLTAHPIWQLYSKKLFGITTLSCRVGSMGLRPNDLEELGNQEFLVLTGQYSIDIFSCCLRLLPSGSSTHHQTNIESAQTFCRRSSFSLQNSIAPSSCRSNSPCRRGVFSLLPLGTLDRIELLEQYQSMFFQE